MHICCNSEFHAYHQTDFIKLNKIDNQETSRNRNRLKSTIWFNPPCYQNVETTNIFQNRTNSVRYSTRTTLKVTSMASIIKTHNQKILNECNEAGVSPQKVQLKKDLCPLDGECLTSKVIFEATVTTTSVRTNTYKKQ